MINGCFSYFLLGLPQALTAQTTMQLETGSAGDLVIIADQMNARPRSIESRTFGNITEGSLFFREAWMPATLEGENGKIYKEVPVKLDLMEQRLYFLDRDGTVKEMVSPMEKIKIRDSVTGRVHVFLPVEGLAKGKTASGLVWCEALETGKVLLLKKITKIQTENIPYGAGLKTISIRDAPFYYLKTEGQLYPVKRQKDLEEILTKTLSAIRNFDPAGSGKEEQWKSIVSFYNGEMDKHPPQ